MVGTESRHSWFQAGRTQVRVVGLPSWPCNLARSGIRAVVRNGRLVVDEPTTLPEGTVLDLVADDESDDLTDAEHASLNAAITRACTSLDAGRGLPADEVVARLRRKR